MDTNLKKTHRLAVFLITVTILLAAFAVTCLYPRTGAAMEKLRERYTQEYEANVSSRQEHYIETDFVNYAMEASYYMFGFVLQECEDRAVDFSVLDEYGWDSDYHAITDACDYYAVYRDAVGIPEISRPILNDTLDIDSETMEEVVHSEVYEESYGSSQAEESTMQDADESVIIQSAQEYETEDVIANGSNQELQPLLEELSLSEEELLQLRENGILAYLVLEFDAYGKLAVADLKCTAGDVRFYSDSTYKVAKLSISQYESNVKGYEIEHDGSGDYYQVMPKNFRVVFTVRDDSNFVHQETYDSFYIFSSERLYWETGVLFVILAIALLVAAVALILPFFKKLNTGWETIFCIHIETVVCLTGLCALCVYGMLLLMAHTNMYEILREIELNGDIEFLGYVLEPTTLYYLLLVLNFLGWSACFFMEYILVSALRQFLSRPGYYLTHRFLIINILKWLFKPIKKLYHYVTDIDITDKLKKSILKIVIANFVLVSVLCCMWFFGIPGVLIYSVLLYIILKKFGSKLQAQYFSIIKATKQMADGDLRITLDDDLGMFEPFGDALTKIQQGFSLAVAEEAKSQQMRTELITNVSHDLKTPLTAIITYVNLLKDPNITQAERESYVETLDQKTQRLKVLIEDLFEVSKAQSGNIQMNFMDVDVVSLMKQVRLEMEDQIADSELYFRWNLPEEKVILQLDGQRTYRIFVNLISNILKYSMPGSRVFIDITAKNDVVRIHFRNISKAELDFDVERLTDRFVRGDESRNTEGSGLGLAIVKSFVELQNGSFQIDVDGDLFKATITWPR